MDGAGVKVDDDNCPSDVEMGDEIDDRTAPPGTSLFMIPPGVI